MGANPEAYHCAICNAVFTDKTSLVEHLRTEHELLEVASYAATTMMQDQVRDRVAREYFRQLEQIKKEIATG